MNVLVIESRYHAGVADALMDGATAALEKGGAAFTRLAVPGVLELPAALAIAQEAGKPFEGYVALGCVIGNGIIQDTLYRETMRALTDFATSGTAIGNGVIIAEDETAALALAQDNDAGGDAARGCLGLVMLRQRIGYLT